MKNKFSFLFFFAFVILCFLVIIVVSQDSDSIQLNKGKNYVVFDSIEPFYVKSLIKLNPSIEVISYDYLNETIGYVNTFGGIGQNFVIQEGVKYEVISGDNSSIILPPLTQRGV